MVPDYLDVIAHPVDLGTMKEVPSAEKKQEGGCLGFKT